ncbi:Panacea domain-containing protein [Pedobacter namyangjuensis]|uniref:Panacea domain-containing protein n=1 Tax=Pedobacter namyangjuensis TaxID=600626 RepID=UPI000DE5054D|nr:type II toxin-antitoxin system antitoxin SocA domain-containing protein [Pedobacter namyangjuensis]
MNAIDVANGFINLTEPEKGDLISNLKVQKLLYYAQGFHIAMYGKVFFEEDIQAWQYGPVVPEVYHEFKACGSGPIPLKEDFSFENFSEEQLELLSEINTVYGQFSALKLMDMTHNEAPWSSVPLNSVIPKESMGAYFSNFLNG